MNDRGRNLLALTVPIAFIGIILGATIRDRVIDQTVAGGMIAILASIVALYAVKDRPPL
jgi:uncharacterized membrane protein YfcA